MQPTLLKSCADSLRTFVQENYDVKLKASHSHELVAAYFGYASKNALLADTDCPVGNLGQAAIIVMTPDAFIDDRRKTLQGLPSEIPDSYTLGEWFYDPLFAGKHWGSTTPPFRGFDKLARHLIENNDAYQSTFSLSRNVPKEHLVDITKSVNSILLTVTHAHRTSSDELIGHGQTTINLPRIAGHIGFGKPKISVGMWTGGARKRVNAVEVQS